jgi:F-type H+-transporting ATPase subunit alpha
VEILKQDQYAPMGVAEQVLMIFAVTENHLAEVSLENIKEFEAGLIKYANEMELDMLKALKDKSGLTDELKTKMAEVISKYKEIYKKEKGSI